MFSGFGLRLDFFCQNYRNPRLRPKPGEVILVGVILFMGWVFFHTLHPNC